MPDPALEELADAFFERIAREGVAAIGRIVAEHPEHAEALQRVFDNLRRVGLLEPDGAPELPADFGDFRLLRRLGSGGMGVVFEAEQRGLGRRVALKLLRPGFQLGGARARFQREITAVSRLDHPGICTVYEAGDVGGAPYLAMRLVHGRSLAERIAACRSASPARTPTADRQRIRETVGLIEKAARAVHAAHEAGIVHRDLKPANILVDENGEPVVVDFGLARETRDSIEALTASGDRPGTPAYMAPEQVDPSRGPTDRRSDVYALGATLYECVTLRPPFAGDSWAALFRSVLAEDPPDPHETEREVGPELRVVLLRALEKDPGRRFQTAAELADELGRIARREPIRSRPPTLALRLQRWTQRNPLAALTIALTSLGLLVTLALLRENALARRGLRGLALTAAARELVETSPMDAFQLAREALRSNLTAENATTLQRVMGELHEVAACDDFGGAALRRVVWSADGELVLAGRDLAGPPRLYTRDGRLVAELAVDAPHDALAFSPDGEEIACGGSGEVRVFDRGGRRLQVLPCGSGWINSVRYAADGAHLAAASADGTAVVFTRRGERRAVCRGHRALAWRLIFLGRGADTRLVTAGSDLRDVGPDEHFTVRIFTLDGEELHALSGHRGRIHDLAGARDRIATASEDGSLRLWSGEGQLVRALEFPGDAIHSVDFDPLGETIVSGTRHGWIRLHDRHGALVREWRLQPDGSSVARVRFAPDGASVVSSGWNDFVQVWSRDGEERLRLRGHENGVTDAAFSPRGSRIASVAWDGTLRLWDRTSRGQPALSAHDGGCQQLALSPGGDRVLTVARSGEACLADASGVLLRRWLPHAAEPVSVAFDPSTPARALIAYADGGLVIGDVVQDVWAQIETGLAIKGAVYASSGGLVYLADSDGIWQLDAADQAAQPEKWPRRPDTPTIAQAGLSLAGGHLITAHDESGDVTLWSVAQRQPVRRLSCHPGNGVHRAALDRDGKQLLTASADGTAALWDVSSGNRLQTYGHGSGVRWACFSPDPEQRRVLTASNDDTACVWERDSGVCRATLAGHRRGINCAGFLPAGRRAITASADGTARWWWIEPEDVLRAAEALGIAEPTADEIARYPMLRR